MDLSIGELNSLDLRMLTLERGRNMWGAFRSMLCSSV